MEASQDIVSCYPVNHMMLDLTLWRNSRFVGWRSDYENHQSKDLEASKEIKILFIGIIYKATWKSYEKESIHQIALSSNISSLEDETKSPLILICNEKKNQIFYMLLQCKLDNESNLQRKQIFVIRVIFNDCKDMLQNVDEIISRPLLAIFYRYNLLTALFFIFQFWGRIQCFYLGSKIIYGPSCSDGVYLAFYFYHLSSLWSQMIELVCLEN